jgi:hypothetical protein
MPRGSSQLFFGTGSRRSLGGRKQDAVSSARAGCSDASATTPCFLSAPLNLLLKSLWIFGLPLRCCEKTIGDG